MIYGLRVAYDDATDFCIISLPKDSLESEAVSLGYEYFPDATCVEVLNAEDMLHEQYNDLAILGTV